MNADVAIRTRGLTKRFGRTTALAELDLDIPAGSIFGYLGPNGAGKSTTLRLLVGLLRPSAGSAQVLGHDVSCAHARIRTRLGYLAGDFRAPAALTGRRYLDDLAALRGCRGTTATDRLAERLAIDLDRRIGSLSHGNRQKIGIIQAFQHDPDVLILDEPTTGLDPIMQRTFLGMLREAAAAGRTVVLSSHVLSEVDAVADIVAIVRAGRLVIVDTVDRLEARTRRNIDLRFDGPPPLAELRGTPGVVEVSEMDGTVRVTVEGSTVGLVRVLGRHDVVDLVSHEVDLGEIFLEHYQGAS